MSSAGKSTIEKTQLARKFNHAPAQDPCIPKNYAVADQFSFTTVECSQGKGIVNSIPNMKAPGIDKVAPRLIKESLPIIAPSVTSIINASLASGVFPNSWEIAEVCPIIKKGDHEEASRAKQTSRVVSIAFKGLLQDNSDFDKKAFGKHKASDLPGL